MIGSALVKIHDVSLPIGPDLLTWPGDPPIGLVPSSRIAHGDSANVSELGLGTHTGTHIDPPFHFIDGAATVDQIDLGILVGECIVADLTHCESQITPADLDKLDLQDDVARLLFKTNNSLLWRDLPVDFPESYVALTPEGAEWLVERRISLVGTDFLSIERRGSPGHPTHVKLLEAAIVIVEGLDLGDVSAGHYELVCLPLNLVGGDGAPARALLIER